MNTETVRSLTEFLNLNRAIVQSGGAHPGDFQKAKYALLSAINTENDLRNPDFVEAARKFYEMPVPKKETTPAAPVEPKKLEPAKMEPVHVPAKPVSRTEAEAPPKFTPKPSADLSASKGGLTGK
jgi:hypothetical protein